MRIAAKDDLDEIMSLYTVVVETVNKTDIKLGWNTQIYPDIQFIGKAIEEKQLYVLCNDDRIIAACVVNHEVNREYDLIDWDIKGPKEKIATIHALTTHPDYRGKKYSDIFLAEIENKCRQNGDISIHLDVIDTNIPAFKLYIRNGYIEKANIDMYYEVVGNRKFWMMEKIL